MTGTLIDLGSQMAATPMACSLLDATHALAPIGWMVAAIVATSIVAIGAANAERIGAFFAATWASPLVAVALDVGALIASCGWMIAGYPVQLLLGIAVAAAPTGVSNADAGNRTESRARVTA